MDTNFKYYLHKVKALPPNLIVKKAFRKVENKGLNAIDKIFATLIGTEMTDEEFLRKAWSSKYKFQKSEELRKHFPNRRKPKSFVDSSNL